MLIVLGIGRGLVTRTDIFTRRDTQFLLFFAVSYAAWLAVFSIQRYAIVLELLCAPLDRPADCTLPGRRARICLAPRIFAAHLNAVMLAVALAIALWSQPGDWFRRPWSNPYNPAISKSLEQPAVYLLLDKPLAYIAPLLPPQSRFYLIADIALPIMPDGKFDRRIRAGLNDPPPGGTWGLHTRDKPIREGLLERYGLAGRCFPRLRRNRGRVAGDSHRGVSAGCTREIGRSVFAGFSSRLSICDDVGVLARGGREPASTFLMRAYRRRGTRNGSIPRELTVY